MSNKTCLFVSCLAFIVSPVSAVMNGQGQDIFPLGGTFQSDLTLGANNIKMTGSIGEDGNRLTKGWFTDLQVTNAINGSVTGDCGTLDTINSTGFGILAGQAGGQTLNGGTAANDNLTLDSTANSTKGYVLLNPSGGNVGVGTSAPGATFHTQAASAGEIARLDTVATNDDPNYRIFQARGTTADATQTAIQTFTLNDNSVYMIESRIVARNTTDGNAGAAYVIRGSYSRSGGGAATIIGAVSSAFSAESNAAWDATFTTNSNDVRVSVTGEAAKDITWHVTSIVQNLSN